MTVKSNLYAKYYFELRALFRDNEKEFPLKPLEKKDAIQLELNSTRYKNSLEVSAREKEKASITTGAVPTKKPDWAC